MKKIFVGFIVIVLAACYINAVAPKRIGCPDGYYRMWTSHYVTSGETLSEIAEKEMEQYNISDLGIRKCDYIKEIIAMNDLRPDGNLVVYGYNIAIPYFVTEEEAKGLN